MAGYSKEFLVDAFLYRYTDVLLQKSKKELDEYVEMIYNYYSTVSKDKFREACSLDADALQKFKLETNRIS